LFTRESFENVVPYPQVNIDIMSLCVYTIDMYVRVKKYQGKDKKSVQIVESVRVGQKVSQKIVRHIGVADDSQIEKLKTLAETIKTNMEVSSQGSLFSPEELDSIINRESQEYTDDDYQVNMKDIVEEQRVISGIHDIYGSLFDEIGFGNIFKNPARKKSSIKMLRNIVLARIAKPQSKLASVGMLENDFGTTLDLNRVYKMMDIIDDEAIGKLNTISYQNTKKLFSEKIDVIFFDCTTLYFESFTEDEFKKNGYSKDLKFNQPQVLVALMVTKEGLPIGYEAFKGDTYEGHTLIPAVNKMREQYDLARVIFVADAGLLNSENTEKLEELRKNDIFYIVGARIKNTKALLQKQILDKANYSEVSAGLCTAQFTDVGKTLIVSFSEKRARKDAHDREKALEKLRKKFLKQKNPKEYLTNYGYKKYLRVEGITDITLDEDKIEEASKWDGLHGVVTNITDMSNSEILEQYNNLWQVENAFRVTKHDLRIRPIFHWKPHRVKAHLAISFIAYTLVKYLEYRVRLQYKAMSPEQIKQELLGIQTSVIIDTKKKLRFGLPSKMSTNVRNIYKLCGIRRSTTPYILERM
jgi:transposase